MPAVCNMASISELACIYSTLILHADDVKVTALANVNIGSLMCNLGAGGPAPSTAAALAEKKVEAKKEESEESDDDMVFGLFD
uniref:60S acidic ribosomal protein P1-like isoform X2 n=1 Tax=Myodes glareolus TaxID=447135 RepID=UPI00201FBD84|nr:60S acidic ribosomal protein P1-like isoform X2 [Myodes glareolus]